MQLSNRITNITRGAGDGWEAYYKSKEMIAKGQRVIELTIGEHDEKTDPSILKAMYESARAGHTGYAVVPGTTKLRKAIAERVETRTGIPTGVQNILITSGGQAALFAAHMAVLDPGDHALYLDPYYVTYPATLRATGAVDCPVATRPEDEFQPTLQTLQSAAHGAKSLLVNSPNNPTGVVYSQKTIQTICDFCQAKDLWLISDEVYDTQIWQGQHLSPRAFPDMAQRTIVIGSMSKSHAMTGSRLGWIVAPEPVVQHIADLLMTTNFGVAGFIQDAALFALKQGTALEERISGVFRRRREIARQILKRQNIVHLVPSSGAMYLMLDIRATGQSGNEFALALLEAEKIAVMPGESFGNAAAGHVRVAMTVEDSQFGSALERLVAFAQNAATLARIKP